MSSAPAPRGRSLLDARNHERSEATRARVLDATVACIAREGFQAANLARIAREAGMTTGAIQHQFGDKATLLAGVVERGFTRMVGPLAQARDPAAGPAPATLDERVARVVRALWRGYDAEGTRASVEILLALRGDTAFQRRTLAFLESMRERVDAFWMASFRDVACPRARHLEAQRLVFSTLNGLALERLLVPALPDPESDLARVVRGVLALFEEEVAA